MSGILQRIFALQDIKYRDFTARLLPTVPYEGVVGVRTPALRRLAKELAGTREAEAFLTDLPHAYYEENNLHAFLIEQIKDFDRCLAAVEAFLPYVDNWGTCDSLSPPVFKKHPERLLSAIRRWLSSSHVYTARFGICMLMKHFLGERFSPEHLDWVAAVEGEDYYVRMAVAWYFSMALAARYEVTLPYMEIGRLPPWTHNKAIQKAVESYRITPEQKAYLKQLKRK